MCFQKIVLVCLILTCIIALSCTKIEQTPPPAATLKFEKMKSMDAIPNEFGRLVGVTTSSAYPDWAQLWFEKPDKTVMVVRVQWGTGYINENVLIIPRR